MKSAGSLASVAKVGGASVLGGGGIVGTGLFIHHQMKFKLTGLDEKFVNDLSAHLEVNSSNTTKEFTVSSSGDNVNIATLEIKAKSDQADSSFYGTSSPKWTCTIKGIVKTLNNSKVNLSDASKFDKTNQVSKFTTRFGTTKKKDENGFVTSCAKNRTTKLNNETTPWTSEIIVGLKLESGNNPSKYVFYDEDINSIFSGTWNNPTDLQ